MKRITSIFLFILLIVLSSTVTRAQRSLINSDAFYNAFSSNDINLIDNELSTLAKQHSPESDAFTGALIMKKANFEKPLSEKLDSFKKGRTLLENVIYKDPKNTELYFLRLAIQENCPDILKYNDQIKNDCTRIIEGFNDLLPEIQIVIIDYCKTSKNLQINKNNP